MSTLENMVVNISPEEDTKPIMNLDSSNSISNKPSVNFGGGIELLMNDKKKSASTEIGLGELSDLENELNELSIDQSKPKTLENTRSAVFNSAINSVNTDINTGSGGSMPSSMPSAANIGEATASAYTENK